MPLPQDAPPGADRDDAAALRLQLEVDMPSDVAYIERVVDLVRQQCSVMHYGARVCSLNVPVALSEALSNAILRGNREQREKHVRLRASLTADHLVLEVHDEGGGFDLADCTADPAAPENLEREDGRGLFLMQRLTDRVDCFRNDGGSVVRLTINNRAPG